MNAGIAGELLLGDKPVRYELLHVTAFQLEAQGICGSGLKGIGEVFRISIQMNLRTSYGGKKKGTVLDRVALTVVGLIFADVAPYAKGCGECEFDDIAVGPSPVSRVVAAGFAESDDLAVDCNWHVARTP